MKRLTMRALLCVGVALALVAGATAAGRAPDAPGFSDLTVTVVTSGTGDSQCIAAPSAGRLRLVGWSITEDAGSAAAAEIRLLDGTSTSGSELYDVTISADQSAREWMGPWGVPLASGLYCDRVSGTTRLTLYTRVAD